MSIPTSLIVVILVAAWLAVLVPIFAKRREQVPETESDGGTFRVLQRTEVSARRRPRFGRRRVEEEDDEAQDLESDDANADELDEELLDDEEYAEEFAGEYADAEFAGSDHATAGFGEDEFQDEARKVAESQRRQRLAAAYSTVEYDDDEYERAGSGRAESGRGEYQRAGYGRAEYDEVEYQEVQYEEVEYQPAHSERRRPRRPDPLAGVDESQLRPVPRRAGRGGYDPDAAEIARAYRYSRRRRVTMFLLLAAVVCGLAGHFIKPIAYAGAAFFGLLMVAYLFYLRRQVRIENDIQQRRLARLRRARQIRPEYADERAETRSHSGHFVAAEHVSQVPPSGYRRGREIVDLEDDDPSFDDLDYYQPVVYRRASGQ